MGLSRVNLFSKRYSVTFAFFYVRCFSNIPNNKKGSFQKGMGNVISILGLIVIRLIIWSVTDNG
ncbi:hypothetical protein SAMN05444380_11775 [Thermophagus xiamenensis]|uniref:Uncharacterized protein n=1 Tax=Thermophagus xiamenensis TaxID=385682 RepID=A0A1I2D121_9BACT|nr:hypothetical protein SAMN05444380_11775 [Thermophagus xiamenensis]